MTTVRKIVFVIAITLAGAGTARPQDVTIKVASFNILKGDTSAATVDVIRASGADVVGLQEADGGAPALARALGWECREFSFDRGTEAGNSDCAILSRFPITQTLTGGVRVSVAPGREAYVFNVHLRAYPYQPYDLRDGEIRGESEAIRAATNARGAQLDVILDEIKPYVTAGKAVFLTGDFNEPSHHDWTPAPAAAGLHPLAVAWPMSSKVAAAGFTDAYRKIHPDPVTHPGNTWTARPEAKEVHDRIDFVYFAGATVTDVRIVGEHADKADVVVKDYPSDHRAVVGVFSASPASLAPVRVGVNLISNGGAEANSGAATSDDRVLVDWESDSSNTPATAQLFDKPGYAASAADRGVNHFYGGRVADAAAESHGITQTIDIANLAAEIDASALRFELKGLFGGHGEQNDVASLTAAFLDPGGKPLTNVTIGNVTAAERSNVTTMLSRATSGDVPPNARSIRLTLKFDKAPGSTFNDGSADNLSLVLTRRDALPEPSAASSQTAR